MTEKGTHSLSLSFSRAWLPRVKNPDLFFGHWRQPARKSTVSRTALNNGLNSYALWRCFPFSETQTMFFSKVMGDVPTEFEINDLTKPPVAYQDRKSPVLGQNSFSNALKRAVDLKGRVSALR